MKKESKENNLLRGNEENNQSTDLILFNNKPAQKSVSNQNKTIY